MRPYPEIQKQAMWPYPEPFQCSSICKTVNRYLRNFSMFNTSVYLQHSFITNLHMIELHLWVLEPKCVNQGFVDIDVLFLQYRHMHAYQKKFPHMLVKKKLVYQ
jgi:hypothetical protein